MEEKGIPKGYRVIKRILLLLIACAEEGRLGFSKGKISEAVSGQKKFIRSYKTDNGLSVFGFKRRTIVLPGHNLKKASPVIFGNALFLTLVHFFFEAQILPINRENLQFTFSYPAVLHLPGRLSPHRAEI